MPRVSAADYRKLLDVVGAAAAAPQRHLPSQDVLEALRRLVPCDVVAFHDELNPGLPAVAFAGEPRGAMKPEIRGAERRYWYQDPMTPVEGARKYSDFFTRRDYHRLELYREVARPVGVEYMMRLWLDPSGADGARFEFDRGDRDFSERDRAVLDLLLPHLQRFLRLDRARRDVPADVLDGLTAREREVLSHVADGMTNAEVARALDISPETVRKHLEHVYAKLGVHTRTAAVSALLQSGTLQ